MERDPLPGLGHGGVDVDASTSIVFHIDVFSRASMDAHYTLFSPARMCPERTCFVHVHVLTNSVHVTYDLGSTPGPGQHGRFTCTRAF